MKWFILFVGIIVLCLVVALLLGLAGGGLGRASSSLSHEPLPDEPITDSDFDDLVFDVQARGYRMSQVDGVVDRLRRELREKDEEIAVLREVARTDEGRAGGAPGAAAATEPLAGPSADQVAGPEVQPGTETAAAPSTDEGGARMPSAPAVGHERTP